MFPINDLNPTRRLPYVTYGLIAINVLVFLGQMGLSERQLFNVFIDRSIVPYLVTNTPFGTETLFDFIRSMFFHGGWAHLLSNMLYLAIFGDNVEDRMGKILYLAFYFACGFAAALVQVRLTPDSPVPLVGASGAIAGVLGAYIFMFPGVRVQGLVLLGIFPIIANIPAIVVLGFWFITQLFNGLASLGVPTLTGGVAFFAHIGGFVTGLVLTWIFTRLVPQPPIEDRRRWVYERYGRPPF